MERAQMFQLRWNEEIIQEDFMKALVEVVHLLMTEPSNDPTLILKAVAY